MKKILFTIIGLSALFCMSSCDEAVYKGRKVYKAYFDYTLKDPESFKVYSEKYTKDGDFTVNWELDYGAKNSLWNGEGEGYVYNCWYFDIYRRK